MGTKGSVMEKMRLVFSFDADPLKPDLAAHCRLAVELAMASLKEKGRIPGRSEFSLIFTNKSGNAKKAPGPGELLFFFPPPESDVKLSSNRDRTWVIRDSVHRLPALIFHALLKEFPPLAIREHEQKEQVE